MSDLFDAESLALVERLIDVWLETIKASNSAIVAVDRSDGDETRWYVRLRGEARDYTTVWLTLGQRTMRYETYVLPAPEENAEMLYQSLLLRNNNLVGAHFSIGDEGAIFLRGEMAVGALNEAELDRAIGTLYLTVEQCFQCLLRAAFVSRFAT